VLYYGDEIGMGDNIWLGDRDSVRTPMQWSADRNAGFSAADPGKLCLPLVVDHAVGHQLVNVAGQMSDPASLLNWNRRMLAARRRHPAFGVGDFEELAVANPSVLAYVREWTDHDGRTDTVLCVNNLSRFVQPAELDLSRWAGRHVVEILGGVDFPGPHTDPYLLTLPGHTFYWFALVAPGDLHPASTNSEET
jgi:maltose alpha-D-glucosyltransferase/alpha-amylase